MDTGNEDKNEEGESRKEIEETSKEIEDRTGNTEYERPRSIIINEWIIFGAFICVLFGGIGVSYYLITDKINSCTSHPDNFMLDKFGYMDDINYTYAHIGLYLDYKDEFPSRIINVYKNPEQYYEENTPSLRLGNR